MSRSTRRTLVSHKLRPFNTGDPAVDKDLNENLRDHTAQVFEKIRYFDKYTPDNELTEAEADAGITPVDFTYAPGERPRYKSLADAASVSGTHTLKIFSDEAIAAAVTLPAGAKVQGFNQPQIINSTAGSHVFNATSVASITIDGVRFKGASASTSPLVGFGGFSSSNTGLVTITSCTDVRVTNCEFDTFYNGCTIQDSDRVYCNFNRSKNWTFAGILGSCSSYAEYEHNNVTDCAQAGAVVAYGVIVTGDEAGGNQQSRCSVSFNIIDGVPSWDGIMTHDVSGLRISNNDIRNVRKGIDAGHFNTANLVSNIQISNNYVQSTTTDTWGGGADHAGIAVEGIDSTHRVLGATITGNIIDGFFPSTIGTLGGIPSHIVVANADDVTVGDNVIKNGGTKSSSAAVYLTGTLNRISINGNTMQGTFALGAIRVDSVTSDGLSIGGNVIKQTTTTDLGIAFTGSTVTALAIGRNPSNSSAHFFQSTSTLTLAGEELEGSATYDPPSLNDGVGTTTTVTVTGAALGDYCLAGFVGDTSGITITAWVSAANTVSVRFQNESGGVLDIGSSTLRVRVLKLH